MSAIKIGKNAIENLTSGMYEESKIVFREYIQNAADQIDKAIKNDMFVDEDLYIDIAINVAERKISIKDNATGISKDLVASELADVADSNKEKGVEKGFRGIGRLGGLAYCKTLRFITSFKGENIKTTMTWDAEKLIQLLNNKDVKDDAGTVLEKIISYDYEECDQNYHFFIVEMEGIRLENSELLDVDKVREYIALNAPVPYSSKLIYKSLIYNYLEEKKIPKNEYKIYVNSEVVNKLYTCSLYESLGNDKKKYDTIFDIKIEEFKNDKGELLAWMWYGISSFVKRIPSKCNPVAGIRLRQSNIQIGDSDTLVPLFKEPRGNFYFIGEVNVVHPNLIPNARRDYFNENEIRNQLQAELKYYFDNVLYQLYYDANKAKSAYKKNLVLLEKQKLYENKNGKFVNDSEKMKLENGIELAKQDNENAKKDLQKLSQKAQNQETLKTVLKHIEEDHEKELNNKGLCSNNQTIKSEISVDENPPQKKKKMYLVDELSKLNKQERKIVSRIYEVISKNLSEEESSALINKIQEELKK